MRRDRYTSVGGSGNEGETNERTNFIHSDAPSAHSPPYFGSSSARYEERAVSRGGGAAGAALREEATHQYYRETLPTLGLSIGVRGVTQVRRHCLRRYFPRALPSRVLCESTSAYLAAAQLHLVVADVAGDAAWALLKAVSGESPCHSGEVVLGGGGGLASATAAGPAFRRAVGVVSRSSAAVPNLSVARNLRFVLDMRTRGNRGWKREVIRCVTACIELAPHRRAADLGPADQFALRLAMELVLDPPVVIANYPFEELDYVSRARAATLLKRVSAVLRKTVVVSCASLWSQLFTLSDTTLLFGGQGRVLYSGPSSELVQYFNDLRIPRHRGGGGVEEGEGGPLGSRAYFGRNDDPLGTPHRSHHHRRRRSHGRSSSPGEEDTATTTTPPRISSRLFADESGTPASGLARASGGLFDRDSATTTTTAIAAATTGAGARASSVCLCSGDDAVDLAVEWSESEAQTMYYAARFYDSAAHQRLMAAIDALEANAPPSSSGGGGGGGGGEVEGSTASSATGLLQVAAPQLALWKPAILLSYFTRQLFAEAELLLGAVGLLAALFLVSLLMHFQPQDQGGMYNIRGIFFLLFALVLITNESKMGDIAGQLRLFLHQRNSGLYGTGCFVVCLFLRVVMVRGIYLIPLVPFVLSVVQSSKAVVALVGLISVTHALLLYAVYAAVPAPRFAAWCAHAYFGFSLMCSGFLLNLNAIPAFLGGASVVRWGYGPALQERLHGKEFSCDGTGNTSYCYTGEEYLAIGGFAGDSFGGSLFALTAMAAVFLCVFALSLYAR